MKGATPTMGVGDTFLLNCGSTATIVSYGGFKNVGIKTSTGYITTCRTSDLRSGMISDKLCPTVLGVACIGDGNRGRINDGTAYRIWMGLVQDHKSGKFTMHKDWLNFQKFMAWFDKSGYKYGMRPNSLLIRPEAKVHGPLTTIFVPGWLNKVLYGRERKGNFKYPCGVTFANGSWRSVFKVKNEIVHLQINKSMKEASIAYKHARGEYLSEALRNDEIPIGAILGVKRAAKQLLNV